MLGYRRKFQPILRVLMPDYYATDIVFPLATKYLIRRIMVQLVRSLSNEEQPSRRRGMVKVVQPQYYYRSERGFELYWYFYPVLLFLQSVSRRTFASESASVCPSNRLSVRSLLAYKNNQLSTFELRWTGNV